MGQAHSLALPPHLQAYTLQFQDGPFMETHHFHARNMMQIQTDQQTLLGTYTCSHTPDGSLVYQYIPVGTSGLFSGRLHPPKRAGQLRLDLVGEHRQLQRVPCTLHR
jgi:hypothetical protein